MRKVPPSIDANFDISTKRGAHQFLGSYRTLFKTWVMTSTGVLLGNDLALMKQIEAHSTMLAQIPLNHPELGPSVEMLSQLRKRTLASEHAKPEDVKRQSD